jgi:hypothetical protein
MRRAPLIAFIAVLLVAAVPAANAADFWDRPSQDFGNQNVGSTSDPLQFVLTATCDAFAPTLPPQQCLSPSPNGVHNYGAITTTGPFAIDPASDACNARNGTLVTPNQFQPVDLCTLQVTFKPTSGGVVNGSLRTTTSPTGGASTGGPPLTVALKGTGIATGNGPGTTVKKKCKKKGKKRSASAAKKKCKKKK